MTGAKTFHQHQIYTDIIVHPKNYGQCDYMNPTRRQAIQRPTASVQQQIAIGIIIELVWLPTAHVGR